MEQQQKQENSWSNPIRKQKKRGGQLRRLVVDQSPHKNIKTLPVCVGWLDFLSSACNSDIYGWYFENKCLATHWNCCRYGLQWKLGFKVAITIGQNVQVALTFAK